MSRRAYETTTLDELAEKNKMSPEQQTVAKGVLKTTERNGSCPCGCGQKAKKCENGRRVLEFKKMVR